ncbi:hypothetical protein K466DRAFT_567604 [Polyporus arcularius HHB13444]|uniref:Uncharacterized protein n=1 Tax=Polyporus arcularius HHB13444 TaxID=1314778 RepID=A0A5C3P4K5_9APHY|nr:hypothetical protein K466DRAFT_567604 [Polyporus arcularius HHB13444]
MDATARRTATLPAANRPRVSEQIAPHNSHSGYDWVFEHIPTSSHSQPALPASLAPSADYPSDRTHPVSTIPASETGINSAAPTHTSTDKWSLGAQRTAAALTDRLMSSSAIKVQGVGRGSVDNRRRQGSTATNIDVKGYETRPAGHQHANLPNNPVEDIMLYPSAVQLRTPSSGPAEGSRPRSAHARIYRGEQVFSLTEVNPQSSGQCQAGSSRLTTPHIPQISNQEPKNATYELPHRAAFSSSRSMNMPSCPHISGSEVVAFAPGFQSIIRDLYLPREFRQWKQLVRAGVLIVGLVERLREECDYNMGQLQELLRKSEDISPLEWISEWLDLQPPTRFGCPKASVKNPLMLLYPPYTAPHDWLPFWTRSACIVFRTLLGLKVCSPNPSIGPKRYLMDPSEWEAWADDVLWVFCQLIDLYTGEASSGYPLNSHPPPKLCGSPALIPGYNERAPQNPSSVIGSSSHKRRRERTEYTLNGKTAEARGGEAGITTEGGNVRIEDEDERNADGHDDGKEGEVIPDADGYDDGTEEEVTSEGGDSEGASGAVMS